MPRYPSSEDYWKQGTETRDQLSSIMANYQPTNNLLSLSSPHDPEEDSIQTPGPDDPNFKPFRFLDLPPEIREKIYQYYYTSDSETFTDNSNFVSLFTATQEFPTSLLLTCYQLYAESRHYYFSVNAFSIIIQRGKFNDQYNWFLEPPFRDNRLLIHSLRLTIDRWGTASWLLSTFLPCLEEMILKGKLRTLEVRLPHHFNELNNETILGLKRVCEDPYLEKVVVKTFDRNQLRRLRQPLFDIGDVWLTDITWQLDRKGVNGEGTRPWTNGELGSSS